MTHHGHDDYTDLALKSLARNTEAKFTVAVVDDGSPVPYVAPKIDGLEDVDGIVSSFSYLPPLSVTNMLKVVRVERAGVSNAWNLGLEQWEGSQERYDYMVFTNNDVLFHKGWEKQLMECFETHPDCGVAGPMTNQPGPCKKQQVAGACNDPKEFLRADTRDHFGHPVPVGEDYINGFCFMLRKDRLVDGGFKGVNFGGEEEYQKRMREDGMVGYICPESLVFHFKDVSFETWRMGRLGMRERDLPRLKEGPPRKIPEGPPTDPEAGLTYPGQPQSARS